MIFEKKVSNSDSSIIRWSGWIYHRLPMAIGSPLHNIIALWILLSYLFFTSGNWYSLMNMVESHAGFLGNFWYFPLCRFSFLASAGDSFDHWTLTLNKHFLFVIFNVIVCFLRSHIHLSSCHPNIETLEWPMECDSMRSDIRLSIYLHFTIQ